jgi:hypothetical protein
MTLASLRKHCRPKKAAGKELERKRRDFYSNG